MLTAPVTTTQNLEPRISFILIGLGQVVVPFQFNLRTEFRKSFNFLKIHSHGKVYSEDIQIIGMTATMLYMYKNMYEKYGKHVHLGRVNIASKIQRWNKGNVNHAVEDDNSLNIVVCFMHHHQAVFLNKLCSACRSGKIFQTASVRQTALCATILSIDLLYLSDFLAKRYSSR